MRVTFLLPLAAVLCALLPASARAEFWTPVRDGGIHDEFLADVCVLRDGLHGWTVCGPDVWRTEDGWQTYERIVVPGLTGMYGFTAVTFLDADNGWGVTAGGKVLQSQDGGRTWTQAFQAGEWLNDVFFLDPLHGWAVGEHVVDRTVDGGATWVELPCGWTGQKVVFLDPLRGWVAAPGTGIRVTADGGATWTMQLASPNLNSIAFADSLRGCAVGGWASPPQPRTVCVTTDGGANWSCLTDSSPALRDVALDRLGAGFAVGDNGTVLVTTDAGQTWAPDSSCQRNHLLSVCLTPGHVWASGWDGTLLTRELRPHQVTPWTELVPPCNRLMAVAWGDSLHAAAVGDWGIVLRSEDGAASWSERWVAEDTSMVQLTCVAMAGSDRVWTSGPAARGVLRSLDGGASWQTFALAHGAGATALAMADSLHGWCIVWNPFGGDRITHTGDGGVSWHEQPTENPSTWSAICALDSLHAWAGGQDSTAGVGVVARTADGGLSWTTEKLPTTEGVAALAFRDTLTGWVATGGGTFLDSHGTLFVTTDGGSAWTQEREVDGGYMALATLDGGGAAVAGFIGAPLNKRAFIERTAGPGWPWFLDYESVIGQSEYWGLGFASLLTGCAVGDWGEIVRWNGALDGVPPASLVGTTTGLRLRVLENPAGESVRFELDAGATALTGLVPGAPVRVEILDVAGTRVCSIRTPAAAAGPTRLAWDGRCTDGGTAPAGVYFARASAIGRSATVRFVRLR